MRRHRRRDLSEDPDWVDPDEEVEMALGEALAGRQPLYGEARPSPPARVQVLGWRQRLGLVDQVLRAQAVREVPAWPASREILYVVDAPLSAAGGALTLEVASRDRKANGEWRLLKSPRIPLGQLDRLPDATDRQILALLAGASVVYGYYAPTYYGAGPLRYGLPAGPLADAVVPLICRTGRCQLRLSRDDGVLLPVAWDDDEPWEFWLEVRPDETARRYRIAGSLRRPRERQDLAAPVLIVAGGFVFSRQSVARLDDGGAFPWLSQFRAHGPLTVPAGQGVEWLETTLGLPRMPRLDLPEALAYEEVREAPRPRLTVRRGPREWGPEVLQADLGFEYAGTIVPSDQPGRGVFRPEARRLLVRDVASEAAAAARLKPLGVRRRATYDYGSAPRLALPARRLPAAVRTLLAEGWRVEAEGKLYRTPGALRFDVSSGIDWFELRGDVEFGNAVVKLPELLAALRRGESTVPLGDGSFGLLPEAWLAKYRFLAGLGAPRDDHVRFTRTQVGLLDALLATEPAATWDPASTRVRKELTRFSGIEPADPPVGFVGHLRPYQREGLGWLHFLRRFEFGGCLADDMGLGKTVMVLALLAARRAADPSHGPSLVVVPRSLVFNWRAEAARFAPGLRVLTHLGADRTRASGHFDAYDLIITTYGTLRRDAPWVREVEFDYAILDEAQTIKNADTESAKAARLLRARQRLALSGTPVENHLGELWSLFEYLNPGMLGGASALRLNGAAGRNPDADTRQLLGRALRPLILRRTKAQVAPELPPKTEQTLYCELEPAQRARYDELRDHYRTALLGRIAREGFGRAKILVLEALLRLRQAACHVGLIDRARLGEPSAKLDVLLPRLAEVREEGHKALVFSQFTSFLAIVRDRLAREGLPYAYLDGRTRDRAAQVARFEQDPACPLFLVSLKAGGLGLNLTAAEYVFLLDPWWNPAVEAQAIDRSHRIGQTRHVFAYRLIAQNTVEEKVLELQATKRDLADAIITADNSLIRTLTREDLDLLLS